jgi:hypothetical protein
VKPKALMLLVPLIVLLTLGLIVAGCGSGTSSTTSSTTSVTSGTIASSAATTTSAGSGTTAAGGTGTTAAGGIPNSISVQLSGDQEVPPTNTGATGTFTLTLNMGGGATGSSTATSAATSSTSGGGLLPAGLSLSFKLEVNNITDATAAHIHLGAQGQNGNVIYPLFTGPPKTGSFSGVLAEGTLTESNLTGPYKGKTFADLVAAALAGQLYVNVHTVANPNGEIRGQLVIDMAALGGSISGAVGGAGGTTTTAAGGTTGSSSSY